MKSDANLSDLALANMEALADGESGGGTAISCRFGDKSDDYRVGTFHWRCESCTYVRCINLSYNTSSCTYY